MESRRRAGRKFDESDHGKEYRKSFRASRIGHEVALAAVKKHQAANPEKRIAVYHVNNAIQSGKLVRPSKCSKCGGSDAIQAHHNSYKEEHWLDVIWLCITCHNKLHAKEVKEK